MHANKRLLTGVLRGEYGLEHGVVSSDGGDVIGALRYG
jgi:hypothetical protein